jgi:hypothetical protein
MEKKARGYISRYESLNKTISLWISQIVLSEKILPLTAI